jgi:hypothetical protein
LEVTTSSETHGFPGFHSKKIFYALKRLFSLNLSEHLYNNTMDSLGADPYGVLGPPTIVEETTELDATPVPSVLPTATPLRRVAAPPAKPKKSTGPTGYKFGMMQTENETIDKDLVELRSEYFVKRFAKRTEAARRMLMGLRLQSLQLQQPSSQPVFNGASSGKTPPPDVLIVVCSVFTGINDAILGIPWWWVRKNVQRLHNFCRRRVMETLLWRNVTVFHEAKDDPASPPLTLVLNIPLRMLPPYYYLQEGKLAQTHRASKKYLDPTGMCDFWFRSPRRKLNLHYMIDTMEWSALNSVVASQYLPSPRGWGSAGKWAWCRRPTSCRGVQKPTGKFAEANTMQTSTEPCYMTSSGSHYPRAVCFLHRDMIPLDRLFAFPDKLITSALWKSQLMLWADCIHPSATGYETIAQTIAQEVKEDIETLLSTVLSAVEQTKGMPPPDVERS